MRRALPLLAMLLLGADVPAPRSASVVSVYDGDTFTLDTGDKVRVSSVNTPELKPLEDYGVEAREATDKFVKGKDVTLVYGSVERDSYGRLLAWVEVEGEPLADHLLELGMAHVFLIPPVEAGDVEAMVAAQERAREANRGIWSTEHYKGTLHITSFHANAAGDDRENVNGEYLRLCNITGEPLNVDGYKIADASGNAYAFPPMVIPAGHTVKVHSGHGDHQTDKSSQLAIYLGSDGPIWNNKEDRATIYDRFGQVVDSRNHAVKKATK
jgi:micrococcal nuclease